MKRRDLIKGAAASAVAAAVVGEGLGTAPEAHAAAAATGQAPYLVGTGMYDITGAVAETGAFGFASQQEMTGFHSRLYAHAFVVVDPASGQRFAYVSCDLGAIFQSVKIGVVKALRGTLNGAYTDQNVMLTATHTHSATAGLSWDKLYQIASNDGALYGWDQKNYDTVVAGIVAAIGRADANLEPGSIRYATAQVPGASKSRSAAAYAHNADANAFSSNVNETMYQLSLAAADGTPLGVLNWYAIHPTAFPEHGTYLNADSKGYAQWLFEQRQGTDPSRAKTFVAAFANTDTGDVVSAQGNAESLPGFQGSSDDFVNVTVDATRQFDPAVALFGQGRALSGPVDVRSHWVNFAQYTVKAAYTNGAGDQQLCVPARGWSFAAGGANGPSNIPGIYAGMTRGSFSVTDSINKLDQSPQGSLVRAAFAAVDGLAGADDPRQGAKPVLLPDGKWGWAPLFTQIQVVRIGSLAIAAWPGEATTMTGRRVRARLLEVLQPAGVTDVVLACYANDYQGYTATPEEYDAQYYEGASTEFGPHQLGAFLQEFDTVAGALANGQALSQAVQPPDRSATVPPSRPGVVFDDVPPGQQFGQVLTQPATSVARGGVVSAVFRGGHPKNNFRTQGTFLEVQRQVNGQWVTYRTDRDWDTTYGWAREGAAYSRVTVTWRVAKDTPAGTYRLVQTGDWKNGWTGRISGYTGTTQAFTVA